MEPLLAEINRSDLILTKRFNVVALYDSYTPGKWPSFLSDALFIDSSQLLSVIGDLVEDRVTTITKRLNNFSLQNIVLQEGLWSKMGDMRQQLVNVQLAHYAMQVHVKGVNSHMRYK